MTTVTRRSAWVRTSLPGLASALILVATSIAPAEAGQRPSPVPPPTPQRTADCQASVYATDRLVCEDTELRERDRRLAELYARADRTALPDHGEGLEGSDVWFRRRSLCAFTADHRACALAAYRERSAVLQAWLSLHGRSLPLEVRCGQRSWRGGWAATEEGPEALLLADGAAELYGIALDERDRDGWQLFFRAEATERQLTLASRTGGRTTCMLTTSLADVPDDGLRQRVEVVDAVLGRARASYAKGALDRTAYVAVLGWLRDEELTVHAEARIRRFADLTVHNYWHRSRLKFPTLTEQEIRRLDTKAP